MLIIVKDPVSTAWWKYCSSINKTHHLMMWTHIITVNLVRNVGNVKVIVCGQNFEYLNSVEDRTLWYEVLSTDKLSAIRNFTRDKSLGPPTGTGGICLPPVTCTSFPWSHFLIQHRNNFIFHRCCLLHFRFLTFPFSFLLILVLHHFSEYLPFYP